MSEPYLPLYVFSCPRHPGKILGSCPICNPPTPSPPNYPPLYYPLPYDLPPYDPPPYSYVPCGTCGEIMGHKLWCKEHPSNKNDICFTSGHSGVGWLVTQCSTCNTMPKCPKCGVTPNQAHRFGCPNSPTPTPTPTPNPTP